VNFLALQTELKARGFDYLGQDAAGLTRLKRFINEAYLEDIAADEPWDFLVTSTSSTAPLTVSDVDTIISVRNTTSDQQLTIADLGWLEDQHGDLTEAGTPEFAYFSGESTLSVFPADTSSTIQVRYFKVPTELSSDSDEPLIPSRWQGLIIDAAAIRAYVDSDNFEAAQWLEGRFQRRLAKMRDSELIRSRHPAAVQSTDWWSW
jgi:hypothetical protein